jgi:lactoylglutathione lyase
MKLAHVALWTDDLEGMTDFWRRYFQAAIGEPYRSENQPGFVPRFATLPDGGQVELMARPRLCELDATRRVGWDHLAISVGSEPAVDALVARLRSDGVGVTVPRRTGDGFYEAVVCAPGGVPIEITV